MSKQGAENISFVFCIEAKSITAHRFGPLILVFSAPCTICAHKGLRGKSISRLVTSLVRYPPPN